MIPLTISDHFVEIHEMVPIGSGADRKMKSYALSRDHSIHGEWRVKRGIVNQY